MLTLLLAAAAAATVDAAPHQRSGNATIELYLLPHTHADVGWLETPENLARVNVSRILDGAIAACSLPRVVLLLARLLAQFFSREHRRGRQPGQ